MLPWVVNYRSHLPRLPRPFRGVSRGPRQAFRHFLRVAKSCFLSPFFSTPSALFQVPYPVSPVFATLTKTAGCIPIIPIMELNASRRPVAFPIPYHLSPFFSHSCTLFCTHQNHNSFVFNRFRTLCQKLPGVGYPSPLQGDKMRSQTANSGTRSPRFAQSQFQWLSGRIGRDGGRQRGEERAPTQSGRPYRERKMARRTRRYKKTAASGFDLVGGGVPGDSTLAEIGFVGHMARQRGVMAEDGVFGDLLMVSHALEESPEVRLFFVPGSTAIGESLLHGFLARLGVVLLVPFFEIGFAHRLRIAGGVIAGGFVLAGLREVGDGEFGDFEDALGALEAVNFQRIAAEIEAKIDRSSAVVEKRAMKVGHVAGVLATK